jgi:RNA polymerase sigma-70 factor (ECF subfamily)
VALAASGQHAAFEQLMLRYQDRVFTLLVRVCGSAQEAEDLAQETFIKAFRGLKAFRQGAKFYTWLFRITVNTAYSRGRKLVRLKQKEGVSLEAGVPGAESDAANLRALAVDAGPGPDAILEQKQLRAQIEAGIRSMGEEHRTVLILRDIEGQDYAEIAEVLELSMAAVKSRIHRARQELAQNLRMLKPEGH